MTILLLDDWYKYPTAIDNTKTTNKSFVRLASVYKKMGIKNHAFPLALVNPALQGIDPFDPALTMNEIIMIAEECEQNFWFYIREIARAPGKSGDEAVPVEANRANFAMWWSFFNHILFLLIQPRQTGKSFATDSLMVYLLFILCKNTNINLLTKDEKLRRENVERIKEIIDELPPYLNQRTREDANNGEEITVRALGNKYSTHVRRSSEKDAHNLGRGMTTPIIHIDEPPFQTHIGVAVKAMLAAMGNATERAERAGAPYGVIMTTTAGKKDDRDGKWVYDNVVCKSARWSERFLDAKTPKELEWMVRQNSPGRVLQINGTFDHRMLGKTDEWLAKKIEQSMQDGQSAERDYLNIWTSGNERSPFDSLTTEHIAKSKMDAMYQEISAEGYIIRWYIPQEEIETRMTSGKFVLGMDTSEAAGRDDICFVMLDVETAELIATGVFNETNLITFSMWFCNFMIRFPNIIANVERRSTGAMIIDHLLLLLPQHGEDPFKRLFNRIVNDQGESEANMEKFREIKATPLQRRDQYFHDHRKTAFGFATSGTGTYSRTGLYSTTLFKAVKRVGDRIRDPMLIDQMFGLIIKNERIDHEDGKHDDMVIAWLLAQWMLWEAKHLHHYGIETRYVMAGVSQKKELSQEEQNRLIHQDYIREQIEIVYEKLMNEDDENVAFRLEQQLRHLDRQIVVEEGEIYSLDELLRSVKEARRGRSRTIELQQPIQSGGQSYFNRPAPPENTIPDQFRRFGEYNNVYY